jgi:dTMP kinase
LTLTIAFEGLPGSGKTTAIKSVIDQLQSEHNLRVEMVDIETIGYAPILRSFSRRYPLGNTSRILLFWLLRLQQYDMMQKMLEQYDIIIADRFWGSTIAFDVYGNDVPKVVLDWVGEHISNYPEITLYFSAPIHLVRKRKKAKTMQNSEFALKVERGYNDLAEKMSWIKIDATQEPGEVVKECIEVILSKVNG